MPCSQRRHEVQGIPADASPRELHLYHQLLERDKHLTALTSELENFLRYFGDKTSHKFYLDPSVLSILDSLSTRLKTQSEQINSMRLELSAISFNSESLIGKRLIDRLKSLQDENEELGRQLHQGRIEQYQVELFLQKKLNHQLTLALEQSKSLGISLDTELHHQIDTITHLSNELNQYKMKYGPLEMTKHKG